MATEDLVYLYDDTEQTETRFVGFIGRTTRFDLAVVKTNRFYGKRLVINLQNSRCAIIGDDDLREEGYLEHAFNLTSEEAEELHAFLQTIL